MARVLLGFLLGIALCGAGAWQLYHRTNGCLDRCGPGTRCESGACVIAPPVIAAAPPPAPDKRSRRRHHGSTTSASGTPTAEGDPLAPAAPELTLQPGDENPVTQGDSLGRPEKLDLTQPGDDGKELTEDEIERVFATPRNAISNCITRAVGDWPLESAKIELGFRIEHSGRVEKMRLTAPALLQRQGLYKCARAIVTNIRFPASGAANVVTFPFQLQ